MRQDVPIIFFASVFAIAIGVYVFYFGNGNLHNTSSTVISNQPSTIVVPFTKIIQGEQSTITTRVNYIITSSNQLNKLWKIVGATGIPPTVDFETQSVIAVFAGKESTSSIAVAKVEDTNARLVSITLSKPSEDCVSKQQVASPYEIVTVPTTSLPLAHEDIVTTASCPK